MRIVFFFGLMTVLLSFRADKPAYLLYDEQLRPTTYATLLKQAADADVVLFGELHNNPICHWLQVELTKDIFSQKKGKLTLGAEMFEADNQLVINEFLQGKITAAQLETEAKIWKNYATDYKPIMTFAQKNGVQMIASNVPRRYASIVSKKGTAALNELSEEAKRHVAPLPFEIDLTLPGYADMIKMMGGHGVASADNMASAQATKDATMAYFILKNLQKGQTFLHFNGSYHSQNFEGIVWYLKKSNPNLKIITIATTEELSPETPTVAKQGLANFVLAIPESMTKTH